MNRRNFLEYSLLTLAAVTAKAGKIEMGVPPLKLNTLKFGVISDLHNDIMHDASDRLNAFLRAAMDNEVDFIIELGDFCQVKDSNKYIVNLWNSYQGDKYHVLGNHDMDNCTKMEHLRFTGTNKRYYSFDKGDFHFIVLDPNNLYIKGEYIPYAGGNFYVDPSMRAHIDPEQKEWLKNDLSQTAKRCILFSHQCLENTVSNREEIRKILEDENEDAGFKKVVAAFSGHDHTSYEKVINGIAYIQINSASNQWVGDKYMCEERFDTKTNKEHPALKYVVPYKDSVYGMVTLTEKGLSLKGIKSTFIPPTPQDLKIPEDIYPFPLVPWINDFRFDFV